MYNLKINDIRTITFQVDVKTAEAFKRVARDKQVSQSHLLRAFMRQTIQDEKTRQMTDGYKDEK